MKENCLIVGLDYGTTYTGVSFCETSENNISGQHVEVIHDWPSCHTKIGTKEKVPSEVTYQTEGIRWGSDIPPNVQRHMWTKLQLDTPQNGEAGKIYRELSSSDQGLHKQPVDIIADFLMQVKAHLIKNLDNKYGKELWRTLPITLVVTVPAVWSDAAKNRTLQAVDMAGFNNIQFPQLQRTIIATEPEAAAIHTIKTLRGTTQDGKLRVGDGFTVCDMGGGTVDLISYKVAGLNPTVVEEATVGNGDQCGGSFVDRAFLRWLERRLGTADFVKIAGCRSENVARTSLAKKAAIMLQDFTLEVKSGFSGSETNYLRLPAPLSAVEDDEARGISDGEITVTADDMHEMFEFSIRRTYELLTEQWKRAKENKVQIKYVFMVGGFSESPYVHSKIKQFVESNGIQAFKPSYAWSAVVRGATAKGLEGDTFAVLKRKSRRHYGTSCAKPFKTRVHKSSDAYIDQYTGVKYANHQADWLIKKGQDMRASKATHARDSFTVATLTVDLDDVPSSCFEDETSPAGRKYSSITIEVNISMQSSLEFFVTVDGKKYGSLTANYD
ncbi:hypothetical protein BKA66DRAFT_512128 [Pyrenochaeta sp. MPI-SDFR-AT-0127]|nr:hypothetical protein BKA66DRAFT_512128 [Pyrenochaeta sp. MPI-SDFR-AT-0127]